MKTALVTGANKGIGFGVSKKLAQLGYKVFMLGRNEEKINKAYQELKKLGLDVEALIADVSDDVSIENLSKDLGKKIQKLDILINNAGILFDADEKGKFGISTKEILETFNTNTIGAYRMIKSVYPFLIAGKNPCVVNISSKMGQLAEMQGGYAAYRMSKSALNALTRILAKEFEGKIKINSVHPGWVKTDMGGPNALRSIDDSLEGIIWAATLPPDGPSGKFFMDGKILEW